MGLVDVVLAHLGPRAFSSLDSALLQATRAIVGAGLHDRDPERKLASWPCATNLGPRCHARGGSVQCRGGLSRSRIRTLALFDACVGLWNGVAGKTLVDEARSPLPPVASLGSSRELLLSQLNHGDPESQLRRNNHIAPAPAARSLLGASVLAIWGNTSQRLKSLCVGAWCHFEHGRLSLPFVSLVQSIPIPIRTP